MSQPNWIYYYGWRQGLGIVDWYWGYWIRIEDWEDD